jgi:hypothetical protein
MAESDSINSCDDVADDPIVDAQNAVFEAKALLGCLHAHLSNVIGYDEVDLAAACSGVIRHLHRTAMALDPQLFRRAVLASESAEVAHG